jgi:hypothetical protein
MDTHQCSELCRKAVDKAVNKERTRLAPWFLWLGYLALAPQPLVHGNALVFASGLFLLSAFCVELYFRRHP